MRAIEAMSMDDGGGGVAMMASVGWGWELGLGFVLRGVLGEGGVGGLWN